jgi:hypothetical protein
VQRNAHHRPDRELAERRRYGVVEDAVDGRDVREDFGDAQGYKPRARLTSSSLVVRSQENSFSERPKWP